MVAWSVFGLAPASARDVFVLTGGLHEGRSSHAATRLADGRVLVVGGWGFNAGYSFALGSAEVYDPASAVFTPTGAMQQTRIAHAAVLLDGGAVLVLGGWGPVPRGGYDSLATAELYDVSTGAFSLTGDMGIARQGMTATLLLDGTVLVTGGSSGYAGPVASAETYDPATGTFSPTGNMTLGRSGHAAVLLPDGRVLVVGEQSAELYDPASRVFSATGNMTEYRIGPTATRLYDGRVLVAGGPKITGEFYDHTVGRFTSIAIMIGGDQGGAPAVLLPSGDVLFAGGSRGAVRSAQRYEPASDTFVPAAALRHARTSHTATLLADGTVLVVGGAGSYPVDPSQTAEIYHASGYVDLVPPTISVPADLTVMAPDAGGAAVYYDVSVTDDADSFLTVVCAPESGTVFPVGTTIVRCEATDSSGNEAEATFSATVMAPLEVSVSLRRRQAVDPQAGTASLIGTVTCNRDVEVRIFAEVSQRQPTGQTVDAVSYTSVNCMASRSSWTARAFPIDGAFTRGAAQVTTSATACDIGCDSEQRTHFVRLLRARR